VCRANAVKLDNRWTVDSVTTDEDHETTEQGVRFGDPENGILHFDPIPPKGNFRSIFDGI